ELPFDESHIEPSEPDYVTVADAAHDTTRLERGIQPRPSRCSPGVPVGGAPSLAIELAVTVEMEADIYGQAARRVEVWRAFRTRGQPKGGVERFRRRASQQVGPGPVVHEPEVVRGFLFPGNH